jgi:hypothetical protein
VIGSRLAALGAASGAIAVLLFVAGAVAVGSLPSFDSSGREFAAHLADNRTRIQVGVALDAASIPFLVWFLATVLSLVSGAGQGPRRSATTAFGCGLVFIALFGADVTALAVSAMRPENLAADPQLAVALHDFEWLAMGVAAFPASAMLVAFAVLSLRHETAWPRWIGWLALAAAGAYLLRVGTLFTTTGPFAADGLLGLIVPVAAIAGWLAVASLSLTGDR